MAFLKARLGPVALWLLAAAAATASVQAQQVTEQDVKAAFIYKFTNFVEWPPGALPPSAPFRLCVVANKDMTAIVERTVKGESVNGQPVEIRIAASGADARRCHILFVGRTEMPRADSLLAAVRDLPVLTVGESDDFLTRGGAIGFVLEDRRVRFDINVENVKRGGLSVSSRLLGVARRVEGARR